MLSQFSSVNPDTASSSVTVMELEGPLNGHSVSFRPGLLKVSNDIEIAPHREIAPHKEVPQGPAKLPARRGGFTQILKMSDGMKVYLRTGEFPNGTLGEIFIDTQKFGTFSRSMLNCFAMSISTGLQHGVPLQVYIDQFKDTMFEPKGDVYGSDAVSETTSIIDAIFRELECAYPNGRALRPASFKPAIPNM